MSTQIDPEGNEKKILNKLAGFSGKRVLEVGCGDGRLTWTYAKSTRLTAGFDLNADDLRVATIDRPSDLEKTVSFARADSIYIPFGKESFNIAILAWSL